MSVTEYDFTKFLQVVAQISNISNIHDLQNFGNSFNLCIFKIEFLLSSACISIRGCFERRLVLGSLITRNNIVDQIVIDF